MWWKPNPLTAVVETLLRTNSELTAEIVRLSQIISEGTSQPPPVAHIPHSYVGPDWDTNPEWEELEAQRKAQTQETIEDLQEALKDSNFLNTEIEFDN
jgi:hypothetical protein